MPTVLRVGGFAFRFHKGDHNPPHVHVYYAGAKAIIVIETAQVRRIVGMKQPDVSEARRLVQMHREQLLASWVASRSTEEA